MIRHMFMDERLAHPKEAPALRATTLTCLLTDPERHEEFRISFYRLVQRALGVQPGVIPAMPEIHAMDLFPESSDDLRVAFFEGLAELAIAQGYSLYRIGYRDNRHALTNGHERGVLPLCFLSVKLCLQEREPTVVVWPVMELDRPHKRQDFDFAGALQRLDWYSHATGRGMMSVDNRRLGEVLYHSKQSAYGAMVDCFSYLLHMRFRQQSGESMSPFKERLVTIAEKLSAIVQHDEVIDLQLTVPPANYASDGPVRYIAPIVPS